MTERTVEELLEQTLPRRSTSPLPPKHRRLAIPTMIRKWARSQVAAYRAGLVLGYLGMIFFGYNAYVAGIPAFVFTTPEGWTPVWSMVVMVGGLTAAIGSLRAGEEPETKEVKVFNYIELAGAIALFLTLAGYAAVLLILGYGYHDQSRVAVGSGFVALGIMPAVRLIWLFFRRNALPATPKAVTGPVPLPPAEGA